jgi:hypothetical protein
MSESSLLNETMYLKKQRTVLLQRHIQSGKVAQRIDGSTQRLRIKAAH